MSSLLPAVHRSLSLPDVIATVLCDFPEKTSLPTMSRMPQNPTHEKRKGKGGVGEVRRASSLCRVLSYLISTNSFPQTEHIQRKELPGWPSYYRQERRFWRCGPCSQGISETGVQEGVRIHARGPRRSWKTRSGSLKFPSVSQHPRPLQGCHSSWGRKKETTNHPTSDNGRWTFPSADEEGQTQPQLQPGIRNALPRPSRKKPPHQEVAAYNSSPIRT